MVRDLPRREIVLAAAAFGLVAVTPAAAASRVLTPRQAAGPFYPTKFPLDTDADLVRFADRTDPAIGTVAHVSGRIIDREGRPMAGSLVEIWQCDALGRYRHPRDRGPGDDNFQGYGRVRVGGDGAYHFRTIRPVPYPGRAPHIHFAVTVPGRPAFTTQMYVDGEPQNDRDFLLSRIRDARQRASVIVKLAPAPQIEADALAGGFDIVLPVV